MNNATNEQKNVKKTEKTDRDVNRTSGTKSESNGASMIVEEDGIRAIGGA